MKIDSISMKEVLSSGTYYRMWVSACNLPEYIYDKASEMDEGCGYIGLREIQCFELEGTISQAGKVDDDGLEVVYFFDEYETIAKLDRETSSDIYEAFESFVQKYGDRIPDNGELLLGDEEFVDAIPEEIREEWAEANNDRCFER